MSNAVDINDASFEQEVRVIQDDIEADAEN